MCLEHLAYLDGAIAKIDGRVDAVFASNQSETGVDTSRFARAGHLASCAGMAPGSNITGSNDTPGTRPRATCLRDMLI